MRQFKHHPDGIVLVNNIGKRYIDSAANFALDAAVVGITNPLTERAGFFQYDLEGILQGIEPNGVHGPMARVRWLPGENAIKAIDDLLAAQALRVG